MSKQKTIATVTNTQAPAHLEIGSAERGLADYLEVDMHAQVDTQIARIKQDAKDGLKTALRMGLRLMSVKAACEHGEFDHRLYEAGVGAREAQNCMQAARAYAAEGDARRRDALLEMGKTKGMALLATIPEVREQIMDSPELMADALEGTTRDFEAQLARLKAEVVDLAVERDTALADLKATEKKLKRSQRDDEDAYVPTVVADMRAEMAALIKKAELAITSLYPVGVEIYGLRGHDEAREWVDPSLRLGLSGLLAVRELIDGSIKSFSEAMGEQANRLKSSPDTLAFLDATEIKTIAEDWARLTATHQHEAALREHERAAAKPRGKGRPAKAPEAPAKA